MISLKFRCKGTIFYSFMQGIKQINSKNLHSKGLIVQQFFKKMIFFTFFPYVKGSFHAFLQKVRDEPLIANHRDGDCIIGGQVLLCLPMD